MGMAPTPGAAGGVTPAAGGPAGDAWGAPSWMGGKPYLKFGAEGAAQPWWRDPKGGYHTVWNPYWGWQDKLQVQKLYKRGEAGWTPTQEEFEAWNLTRQPGETAGGWEQYFPGRYTKATDPMRGGGGVPGGPVPGGGLPPGKVQPSPGREVMEELWKRGAQMEDPAAIAARAYPETYQYGRPQWYRPDILDPAGQMTEAMMAGGMPVSQDPRYQARLAQTQQQLQEEVERSLAPRHLTGGRYGTGAQRAVTEATGRAFTNLAAETTAQEAMALEAARGRMMGAGELGRGLGALEAELPLQYAQLAGQVAPMRYQMMAEPMQREYQEWLRRQPGYRPELGMALQYGMGWPGGAQVPSSSPGWLTTLLGGLGTGIGSAAGTAALASSEVFKTNIEEITDEEAETIFEKVKQTPLFTYEYKHAPGRKRLGMVIERSLLASGYTVDLYEYIAQLHLAMRVLIRRLEALK